MFRWLVLGLLAWLIYRLWHQFKALQSAQKKAADASAIEPMVKCAHCGLHVPQQLAVLYNDYWFCCTEHKDVHNPS